MPSAVPVASSKPAKLKCAGPGCRNRFVPARRTAKFCSASCSQRARRGTKKPAAKPVATKTAQAKSTKQPAAKAAAPKRTESEQTSGSAADNHELVVALRQELEEAEALDTFEGQLAIELAKRLVHPDSNASALAEKVRGARAAALELGGKPAGPDPAPPEPEDDEVTRARSRREEARQAAGLP